MPTNMAMKLASTMISMSSASSARSMDASVKNRKGYLCSLLPNNDFAQHFLDCCLIANEVVVDDECGFEPRRSQCL